MTPLPTASTSKLESLFHAASVDLIIPTVSSVADQPAHGASHHELERWWNGVESCATRNMAFFDERLFYLVGVLLPDQALFGLGLSPASEDSVPSELQKFISRLQLTMTASFIPPHTSLQPRSARQSLSATTQTPMMVTSSTLAPPVTPGAPYQPDSGSADSHLPPVTPNPFPAMAAAEAQYASVDGIVVWEGNVQDISGEGTKEGVIFKMKDGYQVVWRGELPIAYVRTPIQNPLLSLTASVTLRDGSDASRTHRRRAFSVASGKSGTETIQTEGTAAEDSEEEEQDDEDDMAGMQDVDLLGGLAGAENIMPGGRLAPSLRTDLSLPQPSPTSAASQSTASHTAPSFSIPSTATSGPSRERGLLPQTTSQATTTTLRKSYRRVLSLSSGLRVRMRTLFLPQLIPPRKLQQEDAETDYEEGEKRVVLCVEIENTVTGSIENGFEVEKVIVEVGGKGGKATPELICQPEQRLGKDVFPLRLCSVDQYNLLYAVSIASSSDMVSSVGVDEVVARTMGRGDEQRPVSITIVGKPFLMDERLGEHTNPTATFNSRWNCNLDLTAFYASLASSPSNPVVPAMLPTKSRTSRPHTLITPPNAIAGDKRYSLASLLSNDTVPSNGEQSKRRVISGSQRPLMPSQIMNNNNNNNRDRVPSYRTNPPAALTVSNPNYTKIETHGLLISIRLLSDLEDRLDRSLRLKGGKDGGGSRGVIQAFEVFSVEVFVFNRTEDVRRFRLSIPGRDELGKKVGEIWGKRRKRSKEEPGWGMDDPILRQLLIQHQTTAPALIPLENDIRCGPLLPASSLSARIRFMALRDGVHKIEKIRISGVGGDGEFDHILTPVLDVVVGQGKEA